MASSDLALLPAALFLLAPLLPGISAAEATTPPFSSPDPVSSGCAAELVAMSPCLSYVCSPPNDLRDSPTRSCCDAFRFYAMPGGDAGGGSATCLCYLVRDSLILGFPINASRVVSLFLACDHSFASPAMAQAFESLCNVSAVLPPLRSPTAGGGGAAPAPARWSSSSADGDAGRSGAAPAGWSSSSAGGDGNSMSSHPPASIKPSAAELPVNWQMGLPVSILSFFLFAA